MRIGLDRAEIIDGDDFDIRATGFVDRAQNIAADASKPLIATLTVIGFPLQLNSNEAVGAVAQARSLASTALRHGLRRNSEALV